MGEAETKRVVQRWVDAAINDGDLDSAAELCTSRAEGDTVAGRFRCSATHLGEWQGQAPTGRAFERVDEIYFFHLEDGRIADFWGLEDTASRLRQLGLPLG